MLIERYRLWYEHERDANKKVLEMLESVHEANRSSPLFQRALDYGAHFAACRENWFNRMTGDASQADWFPQNTDLGSLRPLFDGIQARWADYLNSLNDDDITNDFEFQGGDGNRYRWNIEGQIVQLVGHAFYHRGMIAMIVDDLGGQKQDTDYLFWAYQRDDRYGRI